MSSSPRRRGSRYTRSRSASNVSFRSSRSSPCRNVAQKTSDTDHRSPRRRRAGSPTRSLSPSPNRQVPRKRFGLKVPTNQPRFVGKFDFEEKYPEDPINEEMGPNARVWRAFLDECEVFDVDMVTEARDGLDLHLVFAGLFSAVLATLVTQTSQALSPNFPALSTALLIEMVALQRAQVNNTPIDNIASTDTTIGPSRFDILVNALWFASLALSLGTALIAVLVKQWLYQYMSMISGTARDRSLIRHYRFEGLQKWHVLFIIGTLPVLLHIALGLFLAGLVVFLIPLNVLLASLIGFVTAILYTIYITSNILPLIHTDCPYRTPFSDILNVLTHPMRDFPSLVRAQINKIFPYFCEVASPSPTDAFKTLKEAERIAATGDDVAEDVACSALLWLHQMTSNPPTKRIIQESLGCLSAAMSKRFEEVDQAEVTQMLRETQHYGWDSKGDEYFSIVPGAEKRAERLLRGPGPFPLLVPPTPWKIDPNTCERPFQTVAALLSHSRHAIVHMGSRTWNIDQFLANVFRPSHNELPPCLPPVVWDRLISSAYTDGVPRLAGTEDDMFLLSTCKLALSNFNSPTDTIQPFSAPVMIMETAVPLFQFVVDLLVARMGNTLPADSFESGQLTNLFIIHDYAVSYLHLTSNDGFHAAVQVIADVWREIRTLASDGLSEKDTVALWRRAENVILRSLRLEDGWCDSFNETVFCYSSILNASLKLCGSHAISPEFFERLISNFSSLLKLREIAFFMYPASNILQKVFKADQETNVSVYYTLFLRSPFLSTRTLASLSHSREYLYPVVATFVSHLTGGVDTPRETTLRRMDELSADPQRLYTVCRVLALRGKPFPWETDSMKEEELKQHLLHLARLNPTHAAWSQRAHYMAMNPRDWLYLRLVDEDLDDEMVAEEVKERMKVGLDILDEFFASRHKNLTPVAQTASHPPRRIVNHWERIRHFVFEVMGRSSRPLSAPSDVEDMELGIRPRDRVSSVSVRSRHVDDAPPPPSQPAISHPLPSSSHSSTFRTPVSDFV